MVKIFYIITKKFRYSVNVKDAKGKINYSNTL